MDTMDTEVTGNVTTDEQGNDVGANPFLNEDKQNPNPQDEGNEGNNETDGQEAEGETNEFDPEKLEFEDIPNHAEKLKEFGIDYDNPEVKKNIDKYLDNGFTPEQIKFLADQTAPPQPTQEEIKETLNKELTIGEKKNYKTLIGIVKEAGFDSDLVKGLASDPAAIKVLNAIYEKARPTTNRVDPNNNVKAERSTPGITLDEAKDKYLEVITKNMGKPDYKTIVDKEFEKIKSQISSKEDRENFTRY